MSAVPRILVTGGAGFIGAHVCEALVRAGFHPVIYDSLVNARATVLDRLGQLVGGRPDFIHADIRDGHRLDAAFGATRFQAVIHLAGLKAVGESVSQPLDYYDANVNGTLTLLEAMRRADVRTLVFSSSATVYGDTVLISTRN